MGITLPENNSSLAGEFAQADFSEFSEVAPENIPSKIDISPELDGEIFEQDFSEEPTEVAGALKHNFTPAQINTALKDPIQTIMLHSDVDKETAEKTLELTVIAPHLPVMPYDDETRELLEYTSNKLSQNKALKTYNYLQQHAPDFIHSITDPNAAKIIMDATANGDLVWSQLHDLLTERNAGFFGRKWQALKAGASSLAKSTGELNWAVADVLDKINDGYIEDLNNGGLSIEQEKSQAEVAELKQHYNGQISELELQLNRYRGTDTGLKLARQIIDLEKKRDDAIEKITARGDSHYAEEVIIAKTVAADLKEQTAEIRTYLDSAPWLNTLLMSDASLFEKGVATVPQVLQQVALYATGAKEAALSLTAAQSFSSSYSRSRKEGVSIPVSLVTASIRSAIETGGEAVTFGLLSKGSGAAKKLLLSEAVTTSALKETGKTLLTSTVKEGGTESLQNALGTGVEAAGYAIDNVMSTSEIGDILYNEGIVGSAEEGIIGGMLMLPSITGVSLTQLKRVTDATKRTANLVELTQKAEQIDASTLKVKEELIKSVTPIDPENTTEYFQDSSELAQAVTSEIVQEVKIHAGALQTILDSDYTDSAEKAKLLNALGITENDIITETEHGCYVSTTANKALALGNTVFWEKLAPYTLQYNQELTQAETERFTTALDSVAESMKELDNSELILTRAEREQAAYKLLQKEFPTKSDEESIRSAATIITRLFESIERGIDSKYKTNIMSNIAQGFALRRGENGQLHFLHKNNLADIREKRQKLQAKKETINAKIQPEAQNIPPQATEAELSAQTKDEAIFRGQEGLGAATTGILTTIDPNTNLLDLNVVALIQAMQADNTIAGNEAQLFIDEKNQLTPDGIEFINNTLLSNMLGNSALLDSLTIPAKNKLKSIAPFILSVDALSPTQSILPELREALLYTAKLKKKKLTEIDSNAGKLDTWFNSRPKAHIEQAVRAYLQTIRLGSSLTKDQLIDEIIHSGERFLSKAEKQQKLTAKKEELEEAEIVTEIAIEEAETKEAKLKESAQSTVINAELQQQLEAAQKEIELLKSQKEALARDRKAVEQENFTLARNADISLPSGKTIAAEFDIIEASDLIISHDPESFAPNKAHGSGQERNYHNDTELKTAIETSSLDVRKVINNSPLPTSGAPIIGKDNIVHGGNGRSMRIARHYNRGLAEYSDFLYQHSEHYGVTKEELAKFDRPVLVRRLKNDVDDAGRLSAEVNDDDTQSKNQASESYGLSNRLGENTLSIINSIENNQSARDFIADNGAELIDALLADGAIAQSDVAKLYDSKNNVVTENGKIIIENALFGAAIHDLDVMSALAGNKSIKNKVVMISPLVVATKKRTDWDISNLLRIGAKHIIARNSSKGGKNWSDYIAQKEIFTPEPEMDKNGIGVDVGIWLEKTSAKKLREDLTSYINKVPTGEAGSTDLFGGSANYTVAEALAELLNLEVEEINAKVQTFTTPNIDNELAPETESVIKDNLTTENTESPVFYQSAELASTAEELEAEAIQETETADKSLDPMQILEDNIILYSRIYNVMDESGSGSLALGRAWEYLLAAQESYNPERGSYENWLKQSVKFAARDEAKKLRRHHKERGSLTSLNPDGEFEEAYFEPEAKGISKEEIDGKVTNAIGEFLASDERWTKHKQVFDLFRDGMKQKDIANKVGVSQGRVAQILKEIGNDTEIQEVERITRENILYKNNGDEFRGKITFNEETFSALITLAKSGDVMTFLHETSHFYLSTVEQLIKNGKANSDMVTLYNDIRKALKVKDGKDLSVANHEYFARSFEAYLSSGKAPTSSLLKAFNTLKRFASEVYRYLKETFGRDNISPDIRDVFDRILATEEELTRYRTEKKLSNTAESVFADARKTVLGDEQTASDEAKQKAKKERQEERLFKAVQISFAKHNGYQNAKKAAETAIAETPFYAAVSEIIDAGGISYNTIKELVGKNNAKFLKRHNTKDTEFITDTETDIILEDIANRHGYAGRDNPVDSFLNDLIAKPTTKEAINILYTENKAVVTNRLREELRNRELLNTEDTHDEVSEMLFDVVALRMAFEDVQDNTGKKREYSSRAKEARARARERKQIIEEKVRAELNSQTVLKAADYKFRQREANKRGREVDNELIRLRGMLSKKNLQKKVSSEILDKIEALQSERAFWQLSTKLSLEINDELQKQVKALGLRRLQTKLSSVREDYKKSILDLIYTYRLPATIKEKQLDLNLLQRHNTKLEDFNAAMLLPQEVDTPVKERFTLDTDPTLLMSDWIRRKERRSKESINNSTDLISGIVKEQQPDQSATYMDMRWSDFIEVANLIESYIQLGSEELEILKHKNAETVDAAVALLEKNTATQNDKKLLNGETSPEKNRVKRFLRELQASKSDTLRKAYRGITATFAMQEYDMLRADGFKRGFYYKIFTNFRSAAIDFNKRNNEINSKLEPHYKTLQKEVNRLKAAHGRKHVSISGLNPSESFREKYGDFTVDNIIAMCLNMGNDANIYALVEGMGFGADKYQSWLQTLDEGEFARMTQKEIYDQRIEFARKELDLIQNQITAEGWQAIQNIWKITSSLFSDLNTASYKMYRKSLTEETPTPLLISNTQDGKTLTLDGGYYPLRYDTRLTKFKSNEESEEIELNDRRNGIFGTTGINKASMFSRMRSAKDNAPVVKRPVLLDLNVLPQHIDDTIRVITHGALIKETQRIINNLEFKTLYEKKYGKDKYLNLVKWLRYQGNPRMYQPTSIHGKLFNSARSLFTVKALALNVGVAGKQPLSLPNGINEMNLNGKGRLDGYRAFVDGVNLIAKGAGNSLSKGKIKNETIDFIFTASEYMKDRDQGAYNLHLSDMRTRKLSDPKMFIKGRELTRDRLTKYSFAMVHMADKAAVMPLWMGAFTQSLRNKGVVMTSDLHEMLNPEYEFNAEVKDAIEYADHIISMTQPTTLSTDKAPIQLDTLGKSFAVFMTYTLRALNKASYYKDKLKAKEMTTDDAIQTFIEMFVLPALISTIAGHVLASDEEEKDLTDFGLDLSIETVNQVKGTIPFVRSVGFDRYGQNPLTIPAMEIGRDFWKPVKKVSQQKFLEATYSAACIGSTVAGAPLDNGVKSVNKIFNLITTGSTKRKDK